MSSVRGDNGLASVGATHATAMKEAPTGLDDPLCFIELGHDLVSGDRLIEAEACFRMALSLDPDIAMSHNNLGWVLQQIGRSTESLDCYRKALALDPALILARRNLAALLIDLGMVQEALSHWDMISGSHGTDQNLLSEIVNATLRSGHLDEAAKYALRYAALVRGSLFYNVADIEVTPPTSIQPALIVSLEKIEHDLEQLNYLSNQGLLNEVTAPIAEDYRRLKVELDTRTSAGEITLRDLERAGVDLSYGRIIHLRHTPRVSSGALSKKWDPKKVEEACLKHELGIVVIDDFLTNEALCELRAFCLESTVWFGNHYSHGRLGAFFREGFNCPLLIQIAEELRLALPSIIRPEYPVEQIWGFKYSESQPATSPHADFAAVNVNFWITPSEANLDSTSGGMLISNIEAPLEWSFQQYNKDGAKIGEYLRRRSAEWRKVAYRANRAIIFNSDLFHATAPINFCGGYENKRTNVTMLYGKREAG